MTQGRSFQLVPLLACLGILAGCGEGGRTPTSPEPPAASISAAQLAAPAADTRPPGGLTAVVAPASRGGGLPRWQRGGGSTPQRSGPARPQGDTTHPGSGAPGPVQLSLAIQPDAW